MEQKGRVTTVEEFTITPPTENGFQYVGGSDFSRTYRDFKISSDGRYLTYIKQGYEWSDARKYDLVEKKMIEGKGIVETPEDNSAEAIDQKRVASIKQIQTAIELFKLKSGNKVPNCLGAPNCVPDENEIGWDITKISDGGFNVNVGNIYMGLVPKDLKSVSDLDGDSCFVKKASECNPNYYKINDNQYTLSFWLDTDTSGLKAGQNCATENGIKSGACG